MNENAPIIMRTLYEYAKAGGVRCVDIVSNLGWLKSSVGIYLAWVCAHYLFANLYAAHCARWSLYGFLASPFIAVTPYCRGILWVVTKGSDIITSMWVIIGSLITGYLLRYVPVIGTTNHTPNMTLGAVGNGAVLRPEDNEKKEK